MNVANRSAAPASSPTVWAESQPAWLPLTIAYTASMSAEVTITAPATSRRWPRGAAPALGRNRSERRQTATPIGTLTRKIQCQSSRLVSTPPRSTPMLPPPAATNPNTPIALARSVGSTKSDTMSDRATAEATAPPKP